MGLIHGGVPPDLGNPSLNSASGVQNNTVPRPAAGAEQFLWAVMQEERHSPWGEGRMQVERKEMASVYWLLIQWTDWQDEEGSGAEEEKRCPGEGIKTAPIHISGMFFWLLVYINHHCEGGPVTATFMSNKFPMWRLKCIFEWWRGRRDGTFLRKTSTIQSNCFPHQEKQRIIKLKDPIVPVGISKAAEETQPDFSP